MLEEGSGVVADAYVWMIDRWIFVQRVRDGAVVRDCSVVVSCPLITALLSQSFHQAMKSSLS